MAFIGKNVIENLTTAMYEDLKIIYREYIQNSADSIDKAVKQGLITQTEAEINIEISPGERYVSVYDNGTGIKAADFKKIMSSIADSTKDSSEDKGFRGIGRLGGISTCEELRFSCTAPGETIKSIVVWNAKKVREILVDKTQNPEAAELVDSVTEYFTEDAEADEHFFKVELIGIEQNSYELLNETEIKEYLSEVAPVPYIMGFIFDSKIRDYAKQHGFKLDEYQIFVNGNRLFKPYTTKFYEEKTDKRKYAYDELVDIMFELFEDDNGKPLAWMWYGISRFEKAIPSVNSMRGIRLRKENIQIGNNLTFSNHGFYKESRGYSYFIGEVFAVSPDLIPNARRDYFNLNNTCREFEHKLHDLFYERFYQIYHRANDVKKALQKKQELVQTQEEYQQKMQTGFYDDDDKQSLESKIENQKKAVEKAEKTIETRDKKEQSDDVLSKVYNALKKEYNVSTEEPKNTSVPTSASDDDDSEQNPYKNKKTTYLTQSLSKYGKKEQKLISKIYGIIRAILPHDMATVVINKIQEELSK